VPFESNVESGVGEKPYRYWAAMCIDSRETVNRLFVVNELSNEVPSVEICKKYIN
jgi:hypothetical protein